MDHLRRGIELARQGQWDQAHDIAQEDGTSLGSWLHGVVHIIEEDESNARYWYRKAGRPFPGMDAAAKELSEIERSLGE